MEIEAIVYKKNGKPRKGKGFSRKELEKAGIEIKKALRLGIPVDKRRSSAYEGNVKVLGNFVKAIKSSQIKEKTKRRKTKTKTEKG